MPHVAFVPFTGFRLRAEEMLALGMSLPGLKSRAKAIAQLPALGLLTLAGLNPRDWECSYHEAARAEEALADEVMRHRPALVAISALTASVEEAYRFSAQLRQRGAKVVLGGLHATACPEEASRQVDAVVVGEGEPVWRELLHDAANGSLRPIYRSKSPFDLAQSPVPRFDLIAGRPRPRLTMQTQRGCPLACEFCGASRLLGPYRLKPIANLKRELAAIKQLLSPVQPMRHRRAQPPLPPLGKGAKGGLSPALDLQASADCTTAPRPILELADDNTFAGGREPRELLELLADADARYFTEVDWRVGEQPALLADLGASGCVQLLVGIESLVFRHPGMGPKLAELSRVMDAIEAIQSVGVAVIGCCIVGCDGETRQSLDRLADFLLASPLADVQLTLQTPFPGTALHRRLQREGRLLADRGWPYYTLFDLTYQPDLMTVSELEIAFRELVQRVFSAEASWRRQSIRKRIWRRNPKLRRCESEPSSCS